MMDRIDKIAFSIILIGLVAGTATLAAFAAFIYTTPQTYFIVTNANDTWFEISEYRTEGWNAILVHVYAFARQAPQSPPVWEAGG
jgi:hypothetical protein